MLLMVEKTVREGIYHAIHQYTAANNKYMKKYKHKKSLYIRYLDADSFKIQIKTEDLYKGIANDVEKDLIHHIMKSIDHCLNVKTQK